MQRTRKRDGPSWGKTALFRKCRNNLLSHRGRTPKGTPSIMPRPADPLLAISKLYHFTDVRSLPGIKRLGGLWSTASLRAGNCDFFALCGNQWSLDQDVNAGHDAPAIGMERQLAFGNRALLNRRGQQMLSQIGAFRFCMVQELIRKNPRALSQYIDTAILEADTVPLHYGITELTRCAIFPTSTSAPHCGRTSKRTNSSRQHRSKRARDR